MTTKEGLIQAKALINKGWTKGVFARNSEGVYVSSDDESACSFCVFGALNRTAFHNGRLLNEMIEKIAPACRGQSLVEINDAPETTKEDVLNLFDKAIANCG